MEKPPPYNLEVQICVRVPAGQSHSMGIPATPASLPPAPGSPLRPAGCRLRECISHQGTEQDEINSIPRFTPLEGKATCRARTGDGSRSASLRRGSPRFPSLAAESGIGRRRGEHQALGHIPAQLVCFPVHHPCFLYPGTADPVLAGWSGTGSDPNFVAQWKGHSFRGT